MRATPPWKQHAHPKNPGPSPRDDQPGGNPGMPPREDIPQDHHDTPSLGSRSFGGYSQPAPYPPGQDDPQPPGGYPHDSQHYFPSGRPRPRISTLKVKPDVSQYKEITDEAQWVMWDHELVVLARAHGVSNVLRASYTPGSDPEYQNWYNQCSFMFMVFQLKIRFPAGKTIVQKHHRTGDTQAVC
jgi:hypothetical protein